jgi:hypothetical protein
VRHSPHDVERGELRPLAIGVAQPAHDRTQEDQREPRLLSQRSQEPLGGDDEQDVRQLLGRQPASEPPLRVLLGSVDERLTKALVQASAAVVSRFSDVPLWIAHADEGAVDEKPTSRPLP